MEVSEDRGFMAALSLTAAMEPGLKCRARRMGAPRRKIRGGSINEPEVLN